MDFPAFFKKLEQAGNNSRLSIEIEFTQEGPGSLEEVDQAVQDAAGYLTGLGFTL